MRKNRGCTGNRAMEKKERPSGRSGKRNRFDLSLRRIEISQQDQVARHRAATECDVIIRGKQQVLQRKHRNRLKLDRQFLHNLLWHLTLDLLIDLRRQVVGTTGTPSGQVAADSDALTGSLDLDSLVAPAAIYTQRQ